MTHWPGDSGNPFLAQGSPSWHGNGYWHSW